MPEVFVIGNYRHVERQDRRTRRQLHVRVFVRHPLETLGEPPPPQVHQVCADDCWRPACDVRCIRRAVRGTALCQASLAGH